MKKPLSSMSTSELVANYVEIGTAQGKANEEFRTTVFNNLFDKKAAIDRELQSRPGDQRSVLVHLYEHPNIQVRLNAAKSTYAVNTPGARALLEAISATKYAPWGPSAGMTLALLDAGIGRLD